MHRFLKRAIIVLLLFIVGAVIAFLIYWLGNSVFNAGMSKSALIVNMVADGIIFCAAALVFQRGSNKRFGGK